MKEYYPFCIQIELVQGCNRECDFCGTRGIERKFHYVEPETIRHSAMLLSESGFAGRILLAGHGEPTLHPQLPKIVNVLRKLLPKVHITMFTNGYGILKKPELLHQYFASGGDAVMFDEYSDNRIYNAVKALPGIEHYKVERLENGVQLFDRKEKRKRVIIAPPIDVNSKAMNRKLCNHCGAGMPPTTEPTQMVCSIVFRDFFIRWDGNIAICCNDFRGEYPVTNILDCETFEQAYYHPRLESARRRLMHKDRAFGPCSKCNVVPLRPGLLPDKAGKIKMPTPTLEDYRITEMKKEALAVIRKREWEE